MTQEDLEFSDYGRETNPLKKAAWWLAIGSFLAFFWGFSIGWVYPWIYRLLQ